MTDTPSCSETFGGENAFMVLRQRNRVCQFGYHEVCDAFFRQWSWYFTGLIHNLRSAIRERRFHPINFVKFTLYTFISDIPLLNKLNPKLFSLFIAAPSPRKGSPRKPSEVLNLKPGELVEIRSKEEIQDTLDENGKLRGLFFMPEMAQFNGKQYRVFKNVKKIRLESTNEMRTITNTVLLEGVYCDGSLHENCDRSCFCFWREAWLKRVLRKNNYN